MWDSGGLQVFGIAVTRNTGYAPGEFVRASDPPGGLLAADYDNRIYECVVAGTTHASTQPTYDTTIGNDTVDGTATFCCQRFTSASRCRSACNVDPLSRGIGVEF